MEAQDTKELPRIEQLCLTWRAFAAQIREEMNGRTSLEPTKRADVLALGRESANLGVQIQLWVHDASTYRPATEIAPGGARTAERIVRLDESPTDVPPRFIG